MRSHPGWHFGHQLAPRVSLVGAEAPLWWSAEYSLGDSWEGRRGWLLGAPGGRWRESGVVFWEEDCGTGVMRVAKYVSRETY
jgi:hypothetical protein